MEKPPPAHRSEWEKAARVTMDVMAMGKKFDKGFFFFFVNIFGQNDNYAHTAPVNYYHSGVVHSAYTIPPAMYGNGASIGMMKIIIETAPRSTPKALKDH
ncbi:MAG: hypothetical protein Ct9H300mP23_04690 [Nitrospinota bacterium]|nr:MAG: hypothetical protein Ct9H300mP23_04690 [Nitrospinota bacterium]